MTCYNHQQTTKTYNTKRQRNTQHTKRLDIFEILKNRTSDIVLLQETHSTPESDKVWEKEWQGKTYVK